MSNFYACHDCDFADYRPSFAELHETATSHRVTFADVGTGAPLNTVLTTPPPLPVIEWACTCGKTFERGYTLYAFQHSRDGGGESNGHAMSRVRGDVA